MLFCERVVSRIMSCDVSTMYTKDRNCKSGRRGYGLWKEEKEMVIAPAAYGDYIMQCRKRGRKHGRRK